MEEFLHQMDDPNQNNDMVVDKQGRAYIGSVGHTHSDPSATPELAEIVMVTPDGDARVVADKLACPNGRMNAQRNWAGR